MTVLFNAGELNKKITIVKTEPIYDEDGLLIDETSVSIPKHAKVTHISATEFIKSGADVGIIKMRFLMRYSKLSNPTRKDRVLYNSQIYEIEAVLNIAEANEFIEVVGKVVD